MGLTVSEPKGGGDFDPVSPQVHQAVCIALWDLGTQVMQMFGKAKEKIIIMWEVQGERIQFTNKDGEEMEMPKVITKEYTASLHEKADLRKHLEAWRGKQFTDEELQGFNLRNILGANCQIQVVHKASKKDPTKKYAVVNSIFPIVKGQPKLDPEHDLIFYEIESGDEIPGFTPEWIQLKIKASEEYQSIHGRKAGPYGQDGPPPTDDDAPPWPDEDDDIPF